MADSMNLDDLKHRLAKLGVQIHTPANDGTSFKDAETRHSSMHLIDRNKKEVVDLLDRCNRVEAVLNSAQALATPGPAKETSPISPGTRRRYTPESPRVDDSTQRLPTRRPRLATKPRRALVTVPPTAERLPGSPSRVAWASNKPAAIAAAHTPLASVLAQYKEAEAQWSQEKAQLRREAVTQRKRANKLELDMSKLERLAEHRALDVRTLKAALKSRDAQLTASNDRIKQLEESLARVQETAADRMAGVVAEREDLKALLVATLQRLEAVEAMVARADASSALMQEKVHVLDEERLAALESAQRARAEAAELAEHKRRLQWQSKLLEKMSEVQLKHNRRKSDAIRELLDPDNHPEVAGTTTAESEAEEASGAARLAGLRRALDHSPS